MNKGVDLEDYICRRLEKTVCNKCYAASCDASNCPQKETCGGLEILGELEGQIKKHVIDLIGQIIKEWEKCNE